MNRQEQLDKLLAEGDGILQTPAANVEDFGSKSTVLLSQVVLNHVLMFAFLACDIS